MEHELTPRGFKRYHDIETDYGHVITVHESSAALIPCVWMRIDSENNTCGNERVDLNVHMTIEQVDDLINTLQTAVKNHYQLEEA